MSKRVYVALCAIAIGKKIITPPAQLPPDVSEGKIKSLLRNGSIEEVSTVIQEAKTETTATLIGAITDDGRVVELNKLKVEELKKLATDLEIAGADQMKKADLVEAITAVESAIEE